MEVEVVIHKPIQVVEQIPKDSIDPDADNNRPDGKSKVIVELNNIHKTYLLGIEGVPALRGVSLEVLRGEFVVIYGTSGGGKTSLLNIIGTIDKPTKGELKIGDTLINPKTSDETLASIRLSKLGFVFQTFNLIGSLTARENVELPMTLKGTHKTKERKEFATASLKKVGLGHRLNHFPAQLSGGEQQRVTIARAIANKPEILLLDEPTGDLDTMNTHRVLDLLLGLNMDEEMTMVMVTHDMYLKNFAHRVVWMRDGKVSKIETISAQVRERAISDLKVKISDYDKNMAVSTETAVDETQDHPESDSLPESWRFTQIRKPLNYKPVQFSHEKGQKRLDVQVNNSKMDHNIEKSYPNPPKLVETVKSPDSGFQSVMTSPPFSNDSTSQLIPRSQDHSNNFQ